MLLWDLESYLIDLMHMLWCCRHTPLDKFLAYLSRQISLDTQNMNFIIWIISQHASHYWFNFFIIIYYISTWICENPLFLLTFAHVYSQNFIVRINLSYYNLYGIDTLTFTSLATTWLCILAHINSFHNRRKWPLVGIQHFIASKGRKGFLQECSAGLITSKGGKDSSKRVSNVWSPPRAVSYRDLSSSFFCEKSGRHQWK